jgi:hypothetical protein
LLPRRHGGIAGPNYSKIIAIDAGNCTGVYQFVDFARQYGLEVKKVLQSIIVSRVFTIYQLAHLIIYELPKIIKQLSSKKQYNWIIVVYDLLDMFTSDPHIDKVDVKQLIQEIASSIRKLSKDRFVIVSLAHCNGEYEKSLPPIFGKCINVSTSTDNNRILQISLQKRDFKRRELRSRVSLEKMELSLVPRR